VITTDVCMHITVLSYDAQCSSRTPVIHKLSSRQAIIVEMRECCDRGCVCVWSLVLLDVLNMHLAASNVSHWMQTDSSARMCFYCFNAATCILTWTVMHIWTWDVWSVQLTVHCEAFVYLYITRNGIHLYRQFSTTLQNVFVLCFVLNIVICRNRR